MPESLEFFMKASLTLNNIVCSSQWNVQQISVYLVTATADFGYALYKIPVSS